jgi:outer membrane biosynthesis protein TonB
MRVPQVNERVKEAPAQALRAVFAGLGQLLSVADQIRNKAAAAKPPAAAKTAAPETTATREPSAAPEAKVAPEPKVAQETSAAPEPQATPEPTAAPEPQAIPEPTAAPEPKVAAPKPARASTSAGSNVRVLPPEEVAAAAAAASAPAAAPAELPLANYDDLTIASLRARLRNLSADQLNQLIDYEKSHAARADVISMFERRIAKLAEG